MKIAFDLDDTLIMSERDYPKEHSTYQFLTSPLGLESLRKGTKEMFRFCQQQGWETWVYTTSYRKPFYIRQLFWLHGIRLDGVINQHLHQKIVNVNCSKHPPSFGLDVIIDDSEGILIEGAHFSFDAIWLKPENLTWVQELKGRLLDLQQRRS